MRLLVSRGAVYLGTTSISLVEVDAVTDFVTQNVEKNRRREEKRKALPPTLVGLKEMKKKKKKRAPVVREPLDSPPGKRRVPGQGRRKKATSAEETASGLDALVSVIVAAEEGSPEMDIGI